MSDREKFEQSAWGQVAMSITKPLFDDLAEKLKDQIENSDYKAKCIELEAKLAKAREALEFYANQESWNNQGMKKNDYNTDFHAPCEAGNKAREALKEIGE